MVAAGFVLQTMVKDREKDCQVVVWLRQIQTGLVAILKKSSIHLLLWEDSVAVFRGQGQRNRQIQVVRREQS